MPGCDGPGLTDLNYCYNPFSNGLTEEVLLPFGEEDCDKKATCAKCKGESNCFDLADTPQYISCIMV